ncbi:hypothetical protein F2Q68_00022832 [Brassica cretica]|uniref:Indole-3-acetic acid-amido synthetase GH3.17-like n=1 Tax=Brassica cretica TaxID=69181 RepID=A0A8S9FR01_BRACR|nr:hypothetical protein F2Q68_00022832 [Brassica cretica]
MLPKFDPANHKACLSVLEDVTTNAKQIQDSVLEAILSRNAKTEYLRGFLKGKFDKQSFKKNLPVITYEDYRSYIDRIANGEPSDIICDRPVTVLLVSSGTSGGVPKLIPLTAEDMEQRNLFVSLYRPLPFKHIKGLSEGKSLLFYFLTRESETASRIPVRTMITCVLKSVTPANKFIWERIQISPIEIATCPDTTQSMYCQLLCGLIQRGNVSVDVKVGHDYEPVVTTFSGLYRYRLGDVLRVTGFYNNAPQFHFVGRNKVVLSIDMDKTYEEDLLNAVTNAKLLLEPHDFVLIDFTSRVDFSSYPGRYVLYWELGSKVKDKKLEPKREVMEECCFTVEESLDSVYRKGRKNDKNIGPLEIKVVRRGAFDELMNFFVSRGTSVSQYKTPRSVKNEEALKILEATVVSKSFSQKVPSWELHELHSSR